MLDLLLIFLKKMFLLLFLHHLHQLKGNKISSEVWIIIKLFNI